MRSDSRLSRMLHVLLHLSRHDGPMTSQAIAEMLRTNPVVVRRTMAGLRDAGYVQSEKGHRGGWTIARDLADVSLLEIHEAVGGPRLFAIGFERSDPDCAVEQAVNEAIGDALREAEALLIERLASVTIADLSGTLDARCSAREEQVASRRKRRRR